MENAKGSKSYTFPDDYTSWDISKSIADFRREFQYLGSLIVNIAVEKEWRMKGLKYDFYTMDVEFDRALIPPETIEIHIP